MGFTQPLEILSSFVLGALMDPATALIGFCGQGRRLAFSSRGRQQVVWDGLACALAKCVLASCSREHFAGDETNKQFLVLVCREASEWAQLSGRLCRFDISCEVPGANAVE